jgi:hypothetical protein
LSLLEVILAIAILGGCIAVIGELVRIGSRHAMEARHLTKAQILCESTMEEIVAGVLPAEAVSNGVYENDPDWIYSVMTNYLDQEGLIEVRVTVQQVNTDSLYPLTTSLTRWMMDPSVAELQSEMDLLEESTTLDAAAAAGGTSGL